MKTAIILISEAGLSIAQSLLNELPDSDYLEVLPDYQG